MEKRLFVCGYKSLQGTAKTGRAYAFTRLFVLEPNAIGGPVVNAGGFEVREFDTDEQVLAVLRSQTFPVECDAFLEIGRDNKVRVNSLRLRQAGKEAPGKAA